MTLHRKNSGQSSGWKEALVFNSLLIIIVVLAARIVISAFASQGFGANPTPEALAETRRTIDRAFEDMVPKSAAPRAFWSDLVDRELRAHNMAAARGFLLAAPNMLDRNDVRAVIAAAEKEQSGTEDQRLVRAALLFLPNDVRVRYEREIRPPDIDLVILETSDDSTDEAGSETVASQPEELSGNAPPASHVRTPSGFSLLGDLEDLAANARKWVVGDMTNSFELRMSGLGTISPESAPGVNIAEATSILKAARRAQRLTPQYARLLEQRLDATIPESDLRPRLEAAFDETAPLSIIGQRVQVAFEETIDQRALPRLAVELEQINRIADATDPASTMALLEYVRDPGDMRRARLVAEAGGERAIALISHTGKDALSVAETGISLSRGLILQIMALAAAVMTLLWTLLSALSQWWTARTRPIALI